MIDQRGFPLSDDSPDIGAVERQFDDPLFPFAIEDFAIDSDNDGTANGVEFILGTDPVVADPGDSRNPSLSLNANGDLNLIFGQNTILFNSLPDGITLRVMRSLTLETGIFEELASYESSSNVITVNTEVDENDTFTLDAAGFIFTDGSPNPRAFYRLEADFEPNGE